jgi:hypothetical protein
MKWARAEGDLIDESAFFNAGGRGTLEVIKWLVGEAGWREELVEGAAFGDRWDVLFWAKEEGQFHFGTKGYDLIARTAQKGNLEILKWLEKEGFPVTQEIIFHASAGGHMHILNWAMEEHQITVGISQGRILERCYKVAISGDHVAVLKWLLENYGIVEDHKIQKSLWAAAAYKGNFEIFQFLRAAGAEFGPETFFFACARPREGNLKIVKWLRKHGCPWDDGILTECATRAEDLQLLKWFRKHGAPWHERVCAQAAGSGNFELLKWAHENGCPWDETTCTSAAASGNLEILNWAFQNGCPYSHEVLWTAAQYPNLEVLNWVWENIPDENFGEDSRYGLFRYVVLSSKNTGTVIWFLKKIAREKASEISESLHEVSEYFRDTPFFWPRKVTKALKRFENGDFSWSREELEDWKVADHDPCYPLSPHYDPISPTYPYSPYSPASPHYNPVKNII